MSSWIEFWKHSVRTYPKKLFKVECPGGSEVWIWAYNVGDAMHHFCPTSWECMYSDIKGQGEAWPAGTMETYFLDEVK